MMGSRNRRRKKKKKKKKNPARPGPGKKKSQLTTNEDRNTWGRAPKGQENPKKKKKRARQV